MDMRPGGAYVYIKNENQLGQTFAGTARFFEIRNPEDNFPSVTIIIDKDDEPLKLVQKTLREFWHDKNKKEKVMSETAFRSKPVHYKGVLFDGHNSPEVAQWIRDRGGEAKAGGSYVNVLTNADGDSGAEDWDRARKNDWVIDFGDGMFGIYEDDIIDKLFVRVKKR